MGKSATIIIEEDGKVISKDTKIVSPHNLSAITKESWKILDELQKKPMYAKEIAKLLGIHEQNVYYYINKLESAGLIAIVKSEEKQGALCKYYAPTASAFAAELQTPGQIFVPSKESVAPDLQAFFKEFGAGGVFDGSIIVGSPVAHGPFLTAARDGHYAVQLGMFLGSFLTLANRFIIKLDTEAKAENALHRNMIIFGGPVTNTLCSDVNAYLPVKFAYENGWSIHSPFTSTNYTGDLDGIIVKIMNPWDETKSIIVMAGLKHEGTKTCVIALTQHHKKILESFEKHKSFYAIVRGLDRDGDGKVDDIELLESSAL